MAKTQHNCPSRLSKAGLYFKWFFDVCKAENQGKADQFRGKPPSEVKRQATDYQQSKQALYNHCLRFGVGKC